MSNKLSEFCKKFRRMKKLKKSSKNNKPVVIFIYGPIAVGKLTVAEILAKKLNYKLTHNHSINDVVDNVVSRGTAQNGNIKEYLRNYLMAEAVKAKTNFVTTYAYSHDYVYPSGLKEEQFVKSLERKLTKLGAIFFSIHLKASNEELLRRVSMNSRKRFRKLIDPQIMKGLLNNDWHTSPNLKNNLIIDNTNLSPKKVASMIIQHFKIT